MQFHLNNQPSLSHIIVLIRKLFRCVKSKVNPLPFYSQLDFLVHRSDNNSGSCSFQATIETREKEFQEKDNYEAMEKDAQKVE